MAGFSSYPQSRFEGFIELLGDTLPSLPRQEAKVAQYILLNQASFALENGKTLAAKVGVSEVTVGRLFRRLGYTSIRGVKDLLRHQYVEGDMPADTHHAVRGDLQDSMEAELGIVNAIFQQTSTESWALASSLLAGAHRVFVTGFQSVRGVSEDFARRLSLVRGNVVFLSPHDSMLAEWTDAQDAEPSSCVILVDTVPYARESIEMARLTREQGRKCIIVSDEYCHWGQAVSDVVIYSPSKTGLFFESTVGIVLTLGLLVDAVSRAHPEASRERLLRWQKQARRLKLF